MTEKGPRFLRWILFVLLFEVTLHFGARRRSLERPAIRKAFCFDNFQSLMAIARP